MSDICTRQSFEIIGIVKNATINLQEIRAIKRGDCLVINVNHNAILGLPPYMFFAGLGIVICSSLYFLMLYFSHVLLSYKHLILLGFAANGVFFGARLFGCLTNIASCLYFRKTITFDVLSKASLVYYGGLLGSVGLYLIGLKIVGLDDNSMVLKNAFAVLIPLFHFFGRIGCLYAGCCYRREYYGIGKITYIRNGIVSYSFPVQMLESCMECLLFLLLCYNFFSSKKTNVANNELFTYFFLYSIGRFVLEFFRGDTIRGVFGFISFSQIISLSILLFIITRGGKKKWSLSRIL